MKKRSFSHGGRLAAALLSAALILSLFAGCAAKAAPETPAAAAPTESIRRYYERRATADTEHDYSRMSLETLDAMSTGTASAAVDTDELRVELTGAVRSGESAEIVLRCTAKKLDTVLRDGGTPKNYRFGDETIPLTMNGSFDAVSFSYTFSDEDDTLAPNQFDLHYWLVQYPSIPDSLTLTLTNFGYYDAQFTPVLEGSWTVDVTFDAGKTPAQTVDVQQEITADGVSFLLESVQVSPFACTVLITPQNESGDAYPVFVNGMQECSLTLADGTALDSRSFHAEFSQQDDIRCFLTFFAPIAAEDIASLTLFGTEVSLA